MSWAHGVVNGREVGYSVTATCDHPECNTEIDRGLSYYCGNIPGDDLGCGNFFCEKHLMFMPQPKDKDIDYPRQACEACAKEWDRLFEEDEEDEETV